jgi:hypothetical protein
MIIFNIFRHWVGKSRNSWSKTLSHAGANACEINQMDMAQRFAYDHSSSTKYLSFYMLINYAAERVGSGSFMPSMVVEGVTQRLATASHRTAQWMKAVQCALCKQQAEGTATCMILYLLSNWHPR